MSPHRAHFCFHATCIPSLSLFLPPLKYPPWSPSPFITHPDLNLSVTYERKHVACDFLNVFCLDIVSLKSFFLAQYLECNYCPANRLRKTAALCEIWTSLNCGDLNLKCSSFHPASPFQISTTSLWCHQMTTSLKDCDEVTALMAQSLSCWCSCL